MPIGTGVVGVDTDRAERMIGLIVHAVVPHLEASHDSVRMAAQRGLLDEAASSALQNVDAAVEQMALLARFVDSQRRDAEAVDRAPVMPPGAHAEGVAMYLDQYLQTGSAHLFEQDLGPNATVARELFDHGVRTGKIVERDGWFQPASCGDSCQSPYANPISRELLGIENLIEAEAMAEAQIDMATGGMASGGVMLMRGAFKRFSIESPDAEPWLDGMPVRVLPRDEHKVPVPDVDLPHSQLGHSAKGKNSTPQSREWDYGSNGRLQPIRDIDFTDHGKPQFHGNPHQHRYSPNNEKLAPRGGMKRGQPEPL